MIALSEVHASLSLFAEALAGRPVAFAVAEDRSGCWPWADEPAGSSIVLPAMLEDRASYRTVLLHQLVRDGGRDSGPSDRTVSLFDRLFDLVEAHRVAAEIRRSFPGAAADQSDIMAAAAAALQTETDEGPVSDSSTRIVRLLRLHTLGSRVDLGSDLRHRSAIELIDQAQVSGSTADTSRRITLDLLALLQATSPAEHPASMAADLEPDPEAEGLASEATTGVSLDGGTPSEVVEGDHQASGQLSSDLGELEHAPPEPDDTDQPSPGLQLPTVVTERALSAKTRTYVYDEWDYHADRHRPAWCRVIEERLVGDDHTFIADVRRRHQALRSKVRRKMLQLPAQHLVRIHRSLDGDELDLDAAIEAVVDRRSGAPVDDRLQVRRDRAARDVATAFLVDLSASTSSPSVPPEPQVFEGSFDGSGLEGSADPLDDPMSYGPLWDAPRSVEPVRRVIDVAKDAVTLMADALHELGDLYAVYGFSGTGRESVEFKIGKDFDDRTSASSWASIAAMKPLRYTRMGPAVRHAATKLAAIPAQTKLLIVVSDGYPQDTDYGRDRDDRDYGMHDTARALRDATNRGIETFCVTIDPAGHDYLRQMCPDGRYLVIDDVESLPEELAKLYLLTMGA